MRPRMPLFSVLFVMTLYFLISFLAINFILNNRAFPADFMPHEQVMDGFVHAQKAPQMGRPMIYLPSRKMFPRRKKGHPHGEQKLSRGRAVPTPSPSGSPVETPTPQASPSPSATPMGPGSGSQPDGERIITASGVDLRGRDSSIKDQIGPYCTAYAGAAGIENIIGKAVEDLSERHIFSLYGVYSVDSFANKVPGKSIALNSLWPRESGSPKANYLASAKRKLVKINYIGDGDIAGMKKAMQLGHPVYFGLEVPGDMSSCLASIRPTTRVTSGGHAVLVVGYKDDASNTALGGGYMIIKNSWSEACGDKGYQYLPFSYCKKSYCYFYDMVEAQ